MIAVSVNDDGSCNTVTCRWNHDNGGDDNIMNEEELSKLIGRNFYEVFQPYSPQELKKRMLENIGMVCEFLENNGDYARESFDKVKFYNPDYDDDDNVYYDEDEATMDAYYIVCGQDDGELEEYMGERYMIFKEDFKPLIKDMFDSVEDINGSSAYNDPCEVFFLVEKNNRYNIINGYGKYVIDGSVDEWPIKIQNIPSANNRYIGLWKDNTMRMIRGADGMISEPFAAYSHIYNTTAFFKFDGSDEIKYMDMENGKVFLDNIKAIQTVSKLSFIKFFGNDGYLLYHLEPYHIKKLSGIQFERGGGWYNNFYRIITADGKEYNVDYTYAKTYDLDGNLVDQVNESNLGNIIKDAINEMVEHLRK